MFFRDGRTEAAQNLAQTEAAGFAENAGHPGRIAVVMDRPFFHLLKKKIVKIKVLALHCNFKDLLTFILKCYFI